jgi:predicted component of type VI protein secretion system
LGRDPNLAQVVVPPQTAGVSRRHCTVSFRPDAGDFELEDNWSRNGTYLADGREVEPGKGKVVLRSGDRFRIGEGEEFEVRLEPSER